MWELICLWCSETFWSETTRGFCCTDCFINWSVKRQRSSDFQRTNEVSQHIESTAHHMNGVRHG